MEELIAVLTGFIIGGVVGKVFDRTIEHMEKVEEQMVVKINGVRINPEPEVFDLGLPTKRW